MKSFESERWRCVLKQGNKPTCIILNGCPMCGKGKFREDTENNDGRIFLSTGDQYREMAKDPVKGPIISAHQDIGELVPDYIHIPAFRPPWAQLISMNWGKQLGLDGAIRTPGQVEALMPLVESISMAYEIIQIFINPTREEIWRRFRFVAAGKDPNRQGRKDDLDEEVFKTRLREFDSKTLPAIWMIKERGIKTIEIPVGYNRPKAEMIMRVRTALGLPMLVTS